VPEYVAKHWFGDWDIEVTADAMHNNAERTHGVEKRRVATIWGGYIKEQPNLDVKGSWKTLRIVGAPRVPRVLIQTLDSAMRVNPHINYRPWEHFAWDKDVVNVTREQTRPSDNLQVTPDQLQKIIQEQVTAALKERGNRTKAAA
jgi:hypothetical protein